MSYDKTVLTMAALRFLSAAIIFTAAGLMLKYNTVPQALRLNAFLGLVGPLILIAVSVLGIAEVAGEVSWSKLALLIVGVILILIGTSK